MKKTKKVVAGIVLGTFTFGCVTPAFASEEIDTAMQVQSASIETSQAEILSYDVEQYSLPSTVLKAVKKIVKEYWDELPLPDKADTVRDALLEALDFYFQYSDDVEEAIRNAIYDVFPNANSTVVETAVFFIIALLPF